MINSKGQMFVEDNDIIELMLTNRQVKILPSNKNSYHKFEAECKKYGITTPFILDDSDGKINWNISDEYKDISIRDYILEQHDLDMMQKARVDSELTEFEERGLNNLLRFLIYFVKILRDNNIVYGVGRGSSIASYVLYLLGVHRIDSYKFNLDIKEFLK
jgi:DNA polymerase III alpha subunit